MALAIWQETIVDESGNLLPGAIVTVRRETPGAPLAPIKANRSGGTAKENPFTADAVTAEALFHAVGGAYRIDIVSGAFSKTLRYVAIGRGAETDITGLTPKGDWGSETEYSIGNLVTHSGRTFASNIDENTGNTPPTADESSAYWTWLPATPGQDGTAAVSGTSTTSLSIGTGEKVFTTQENRGWGAGARLRASSDANSDRDYMEGTVTSYSVDELTLEVDLVGPNAVAGPHDDWTINLAGEQGSQGEDGVDPGFLFNWEVETSTPPSVGCIRANNADLSSATEIYVSDTTRGGSNVAALIQALAPGAKTVPNSILLTEPGSEDQAGLSVTGITDESGYTTLAVSGHAGETAFAAGAISLQREISGADGEDGLGTGDVVGPASSTNDNLAAFDGETGKLLKDSGAALPTGNIVGTTDAQTLTNKTIDGGTIVNGVGGTYAVTDQGTKSTGTFTPDPSDGFFQKAVNNGAHTLAATSETGAFRLVYTNGASAGVITASGFDEVIDADTALEHTVENSIIEIIVVNDGVAKVATVTLLTDATP